MAAPTARSPNAKHIELSALVPALSPCKDLLLENKGRPYSSVQMGAAPDVENLLKFQPMLDPLVSLDARGGIFAQHDIVLGLIQLGLENKEWWEKVIELATQRETNRLAVLEKMAYYIRVMLNHLRKIKRDVAKGRSVKGDLVGLMKTVER